MPLDNTRCPRCQGHGLAHPGALISCTACDGTGDSVAARAAAAADAHRAALDELVSLSEKLDARWFLHTVDLDDLSISVADSAAGGASPFALVELLGPTHIKAVPPLAFDGRVLGAISFELRVGAIAVFGRIDAWQVHAGGWDLIREWCPDGCRSRVADLMGVRRGA